MMYSEQVTVFLLKCDNCGKRYYNNYELGNYFLFGLRLAQRAESDGWINDVDNHLDFCCKTCAEEYWAKRIKRGRLLDEKEIEGKYNDKEAEKDNH